MHKRLVPNLLWRRAIDLGKVTFLIFLPIFFRKLSISSKTTHPDLELRVYSIDQVVGNSPAEAAGP